jgi:hypothetical protein
MNKNLLSQCFIKQGTFKPVSLDSTIEVTIRELKISENEEFRKILTDDTKTQKDAMFYAVKCSMIEPKFFSDEDLENLSMTGFNLITEIYNEIPLIGKSKKERAQYFTAIEKLIAKQQETKTTLDDEEKK